MERIGRSYYGEEGVRKICHDVKQNDDRELRNNAIKTIAKDLISRGIVKENDILIPAPQHTGDAEYTKEIAEMIASETGAKVADILKCIPHLSLYEQKNKGAVLHVELYVAGKLPEGKSYFFVDNVISTGTTFRMANQLLDGKLKPLVYAVDETKIPDLGISNDSVIKKLKEIKNKDRNIQRKRVLVKKDILDGR